jgi:hypothetical protein|tara:strand:- start:6 stop:290 length:285 start_codon:yes stop_codon:yes gene_type:complete
MKAFMDIKLLTYQIGIRIFSGLKEALDTINQPPCIFKLAFIVHFFGKNWTMNYKFICLKYAGTNDLKDVSFGAPSTNIHESVCPLVKTATGVRQ